MKTTSERLRNPVVLELQKEICEIAERRRCAIQELVTECEGLELMADVHEPKPTDEFQLVDDQDKDFVGQIEDPIVVVRGAVRSVFGR